MARGFRRWLLDLHLWSGVAVAPYFVIYGLSTFSYNHPEWSALAPGDERIEWQAPVDAAAGSDAASLVAAARRDLDLIGYTAERQVRTDASGRVHFRVGRPGKRYEVVLDPASGSARVSETRHGFWGVVRGLHGLSGLPGSWWAYGWKLYTWLSIAAIFFAVASGVLLWWPRRARERAGWVSLGLGSAIGAALVWGVWW